MTAGQEVVLVIDGYGNEDAGSFVINIYQQASMSDGGTARTAFSSSPERSSPLLEILRPFQVLKISKRRICSEHAIDDEVGVLLSIECEEDSHLCVEHVFVFAAHRERAIDDVKGFVELATFHEDPRERVSCSTRYFLLESAFIREMPNHSGRGHMLERARCVVNQLVTKRLAL